MKQGRLRPRCCHLESYFKRPKSSSVRPLACNRYHCAQFIAKPKAACALRFSWAATSNNLGLRANMTSSIKPEEHNVSLRRQRRTEPPSCVTCTKKLAEDRTCSREDMIAGRQTRTHRQTRSSQHSAPLPGAELIGPAESFELSGDITRWNHAVRRVDGTS